MNLQSLPAATGAPYPASMAPSSGAFSTVTTHGCFPYSTPSIAHPSLSGILPCNNNMISYSGLPEEPSGGIFSGLSPEGTNCADPGDIDYRVESQQIPGPGRTVDESDNRDEWFVPADITWNWHQMSWQHDEQHMVHESVSVPSEEPQQLCPTVSPLATTNNAHCPKRAKARMRWTMEMHDRFVDAVNLLGGCESKISALFHYHRIKYCWLYIVTTITPYYFFLEQMQVLNLKQFLI